MFCKKAIYVNWGNIPNLEFEFGPVNLFSGGNGSGKTTAADGLQSLMTAAHENLFTYNPGQDETTQKGRGGKQVRTLASYILGCDDGSYSRPRPTDGYVAGIFHPTQGESGECFTAVMCVRASLDSAGSSRQARQDNILFIVLPNEALTLEHFVREDKGGKYVVPLSDIANLLRKEFGKDSVETYDKKGPYLRRLYGAMRGLKGAVSDREAKHAARTFSNFMAYKPVKSITEFVAREVLDPKDLSEDIKQVSELMKTIHSMEEETRQVNDAIESLEQADSLAKKFVENWTGWSVSQYAEVTRKLQQKQNEYLKLKNEQRKLQGEFESTETRIQNNRDKKQNLHDQLIELEAQRQGISVLKDKDLLEAEASQLQSQLAECAPGFLKQTHQLEENHKHTQALLRQINSSSIGVDFPTLESKTFKKSLNALLETGKDTGIDAQKVFNSDWVGIGDLENKMERLVEIESAHRDVVYSLHDAEYSAGPRSLRDQIVNILQDRQDHIEKNQLKIKAKELEIQKLENHSISYPPYVELALAAIENQCPKARPRVLCDFIEVIEPRWQMAIEGYVGGARFSIIVEPEYEAEAIRIVRGIKGRSNKARVVQGEKAQLDAANIHLPQGSIIDIMEFDHKIAEYYLIATYGNVVRVDDENELRKTRRGITANGLGSGGYSMFRCDLDDAELVFGQGARQRALQAKQKQLEAFYAEAQQLQEQHKQLQILIDCIDQIKPVACAAAVKQMLAIYRQLQKCESQLQKLDLSDFSALDEVLSDAKASFREAEEEGQSLQKYLGELASNAKQLERGIKKVADEQDVYLEEKDQKEKAVHDIATVYGDFKADDHLEEADKAAAAAKNDFDFENDITEKLIKFKQYERELHNVVLNYNQTCNVYSSVAYLTGSGDCESLEFFKGILSVKKEVSAAHNRLKNNVLVGKHEKLSALKESFNTAFITNLCHSIYQSINDGKRILDELNAELEYHRFGVDKERFYFGYQWVPEFKEYQRFFKEVIDSPDLGDGSSLFEAKLSDKSAQVRDKLLAMLLDKDEQVALRELKRISDYRNYREYEIYKEPLNKDPIALSKYGTGSGGQLETPAYIIRSAAVTSAFKFNEGNTHCRTVLVDEAFSKMDETRSREVIHYLTETLGLQLLFIMPTSKSGPFMDLISHQVVFSKCPVTSKIGELNTRVNVNRAVCNQDKIQELWASHRSAIRHQNALDFMEEFV